MANNDQLDLSNILKKAEDAVQEVKDDQLKKIAFERVVDFLLQTSMSHTKVKVQKTEKSKSTKKTSKAIKSDGPLAWLRELVDEDFFSKQKSMGNILEELNKRSHILKQTDLTSPLRTLCHEKKLRRDKLSSEEGDKKVLHWFNW